MSRYASASLWLKALGVSLAALACLGAAASVTLLVALGGLHHLSAHLRPSAALQWLWYFRADPQVRRWLGAGLLVAFSLGLVVAIVEWLRAHAREIGGKQ